MALLKRTFILLALAGVIGVVGAELVLRFVFPQPENAPFRLILENEIDGVEEEVEFVLNEQSLRTINWDARGKKPGARRVLFVGGTSTEGLMHRAENTWWGRIWAQLQGASSAEVECAAYSVTGDSILRAAKWCEENLEGLDVDLLVISFGFGDLLNEGSEYRYDPDKFVKIATDTRSGWKVVATDYSHLYRALRVWRDRKRNVSSQRAMGQKNYVKDALERQQARASMMPVASEIRREVKNDQLLEYLDGVDRFIEIARRENVKLLVLGEPVLHHVLLGPEETMMVKTPIRVGPSVENLARPDPGWVDRELERFYEAAALRCGEKGVGFYNLNGKVPKTKRYFIDDTRLTIEGGQAAAERVAPLAGALLEGRNPAPEQQAP